MTTTEKRWGKTMAKNIRKSFIALAISIVFVVVAAFTAQASMIGLTGFVNFFDEPNPWGITDTSEVTGTAYWNENLLSGGEEVLENFWDPIMNLKVAIGDFSYNFFDDTSFSLLTFGFKDGFLKNIFLLGEGPGDAFFDISYDFFGSANVFILATPEYSYRVTGEIAPVPEPGTFLLLGAGLGGLVFIQRRRKGV